MDKYIIYARKSSESEDRQVLSIESQINELQKLARKLELPNLEVLTESQSAKSPGRPIFSKMMEKVYGGNVKGIICWKLDRLARNAVDGGAIIWALKQNGVEIITPSQTYSQGSENTLLMYVEFGMAQKFIDDLSKNVKRGLMAKVEKGWYPVVAPVGYSNTPYKDKGYKIVVKDPKRFPIVRKMWDLMLTGNYSPPNILEVANEKWGLRTRKSRRQGGKPFSRSGIYRLFTNPFYYGWFEFNGKLYKGKHEAMITEEEFDRVQFLLGRKGRPRPSKHEFALTGLIKCGECGCFITAETKTKHYPTTNNTAHYTYYHCTHKRKDIKCHQKPVKENDLNVQVVALLSEIQISEKFKEWALKYLREIHEQEVDDRSHIYQNLQETYNGTQKELDNLLDLRIRELVSDQEYQTKKADLLKEQRKLKENLGDTEDRASKWLELSEKTFNLACYARHWFEKGNLNDKKSILLAIGSDFVLKDRKLDVQLQKPYFILKDAKEHEEKYAERFELPESVVLSPQTRDFAIQNPTWLRGQDSDL